MPPDRPYWEKIANGYLMRSRRRPSRTPTLLHVAVETTENTKQAHIRRCGNQNGMCPPIQPFRPLCLIQHGFRVAPSTLNDAAITMRVSVIHGHTRPQSGELCGRIGHVSRIIFQKPPVVGMVLPEIVSDNRNDG